jgi:HEPN domain-containing protein
MKDSTSKWIRKAEADFRSMTLEFSAPGEPNFDAVCFFAQQCIEKWLKAILVEFGVSFPKSHDLQKLLLLILPKHSELSDLEGELNDLYQLSINVRYPDDFASSYEARSSMEIAERIRARLMQVLPLGPLFDHS